MDAWSPAVHVPEGQVRRARWAGARQQRRSAAQRGAAELSAARRGLMRAGACLARPLLPGCGVVVAAEGTWKKERFFGSAQAGERAGPSSLPRPGQPGLRSTLAAQCVAHSVAQSVARSAPRRRAPPWQQAFDEQYGLISPIPDHDGTECLKWDPSLWSHADHFKVDGWGRGSGCGGEGYARVGEQKRLFCGHFKVCGGGGVAVGACGWAGGWAGVSGRVHMLRRGGLVQFHTASEYSPRR